MYVKRLLLHGSASASDTACPAAEDLDEMNIEIMRNTLYKAYLDDFAKFCNKLGGSTAAVMGDLLSFEVRMQQLCREYFVSPCLSGVSHAFWSRSCYVT